MALIVKNRKSVMGIILETQYVNITMNINEEGEVFASPVLYADEQAYNFKEPLSASFPLVDLGPKYNEQGELIEDEFIKTNVRKGINNEYVFVTTIKDDGTAVDLYRLAADKIKQRLVDIQFAVNLQEIVDAKDERS